MADLIRSGAAFLAGQLKAAAGTDIEYQRATGGAPIELTATVGRSMYEAQTESGVIERYESRDYIVLASDLTFTPVRGDKIREVVAGVTGVYEVASPRGVPLTHPGDAFNSSTRIHTKKIN